MLICILSSPRSGAHLLRGMMSSDPTVVDLGAPWHPNESNAHRLVAMDYASSRRFLTEVQDQRRVVLTNVKTHTEYAEVLRAHIDAEAKFIFLYRRDYVAQYASFALAAQYKCYYGPAPEGAKITINADKLRDWVYRQSLSDTRVRATLADLPHIELAFEDITTPSASAAINTLAPIKLGPPTTQKTAPPLEEFVTNLVELR